VARGAFVRDVVLRGSPTIKIYFPSVRHEPTPTPTATPQVPYLYNYTFGSGLNTDPQFLEWGGKVSNATCYTAGGGGCNWGQDIVTSGNPGGAMTMNQTGLDALAGASPNNTAPTNFELSADFDVLQGKANARIGLVFGASDNAFDRNRVPYFDPNRNMYKFDLQFNEIDNTLMSYYRLQKFVTSSNGYVNIVEKSQLPAGLVGNTGTWNNIKVQRLGTNIKVYVNGSLLFSVDDDTYVGSRKYGLFLQTTDHNSTTNPIKMLFDNVRVRSLP
jgi:hypothetical protein